MLKIRTTVVSGGEPRILAKGGGKQRTTPLDYNRSWDSNHGIAAANLLLALGYTGTLEAENIQHKRHGDWMHDFWIE